MPPTAMDNLFKAARVTDNVFWVGAVDWSIRDFHGYLTGRGTTYNAYLVLADKITLIDTVKAPFKGELLSRIASIIDPEDIAYIVSNHSELDHTGSLPDVIEIVKPERVFASAAGVKAIDLHFHRELAVEPVKDGEILSLGNMELSFMETRMLHWPDSMFSFLVDEGILFSQDGFGMHLASSERFADELPSDIVHYEAKKYFANILTPFSRILAKVLDKVAGSGMDIRTIAPDHGPIWREDVGRILGFYSKWAAQEPSNKAVIVYDTMWGGTAMMARAIAEGLAASGAGVKLMALGASHRSDVATEVLDAGALIVGSPTINNQMFPTVAEVLSYLRGLKPSNLIGAAFGSYGWSGEATKQIEEILKAMKVELVSEPIKAKYVPDGETLTQCRQLGEVVGNTLLATPASG